MNSILQIIFWGITLKQSSKTPNDYHNKMSYSPCILCFSGIYVEYLEAGMNFECITVLILKDLKLNV